MSCDHDFHLDNDGEVTCRYCHIVKEVDEDFYSTQISFEE